MATTRTIKSQFDAEREQIRTTEVRNPAYSKHFWISNDHVSLAEDDFPGFEKGKSFTGEAKGIVNLFVGEADIFSVIHKIEGDVIICDIDRTLLKFIEDQKNYLLDVYKKYNAKQITFDQVFSACKTWTDEHADSYGVLETRMYELGSAHFLDSEKNFIRAMEALQTKNLVTLDINLFDEREQDALCDAIRSSKAKVKLFNLTNLPDYDKNDNLFHLISKLPWVENPKIIWNIHDRGAFKEYKEWMVKNEFYEDPNNHYLFIASKPEQYLEHVLERPSFYAEIDAVYCIKKNIKEEDMGYYDLPIRYDVELPLRPVDEHIWENHQKYFERFNHFLWSKKGRDLDAASQEICQKYQVKLSPRGNVKNIEFLGKLLNKRANIEIWRSRIISNCSDPEMKNHILHLIDECIKNLAVKRTQSDLSINKKNIQAQLDADSNQISFLIDLVNKTNAIRENLNGYKKPEQKPIIDECEATLKVVLNDAQQRSSEFRTSTGQNEFNKDIKGHFNHISYLCKCLDRVEAIKKSIIRFNTPDQKSTVDEIKTLLTAILEHLQLRSCQYRHSGGQLIFKDAIEEDFNQISFLTQCLQTTEVINERFTSRYNKPEQQHIIDGSQKLLTEILADARKRSQSSEFKTPDGQARFKKDMIEKVQKQKFQHRVFDTEKHDVIQCVLNFLMCIPVFGLVKLAATGTYFFHPETRREQIFVEEIENAPTSGLRR